MDSDSDEMLVRRVLRGNDQAYGLLVERYQRPVYNLMYRFCRNEPDAAELSQDVFLRAYERLSAFDGKRKFFPWLYTLAMNLATDWQRSHARKQQGLARLRWETPPHDMVSGQEKSLLNREEAARLYGALDVLPAETRELVLLRYKQELPIRELAEIFKLSESGVKMRISRALQRMKEVLGGKR
jgi:RNA polymerase sigma-70 factor (ECF subfamily)